MQYPIPVLVINPSNFDWISFLLGGALGSFVGALIILGMERYWDRRVEENKFIQEKKQVSKALEAEIGANLSICGSIIESLKSAHHSIYIFNNFETGWLEKYSAAYIDFTNEDSLRLYSFLSGAKRLMYRFGQVQSAQHGLSASGRVLDNFQDLAYKHNQGMLKIAEELMPILKAIKNHRKDNCILLDDVKNEPNLHLN